MQHLEEFCRKIDLQYEIVELVMEFDKKFDYSQIETSMKKLFDRKTWTAGREEIKSVLGVDDRGIGILTCMLKCGMQTYDQFLARGMEEQILIDTMKCFKRFIDEHMESYGTYAFDRDFWTARQISGNLFRIGELEYEFVEEEDDQHVAIHIPSDANITLDVVRDSYQKARKCIEIFFPEYKSVRMICESWLLSPALKKCLKKDSNIIRFQNLFVIEKMDYESMDFMEWVFKNPNLTFDELPENTSLQRNMKKYLIEGGIVGEGTGRLVEANLL